MSLFTNNINNNSHYQPKSIRIPLIAKKDIKSYPQHNYLNEDTSNAFFFPQYIDENIRSKSSSYFNNENETRCSLVASTSFEYDQVIEDNQSNLLDLELSRANSELVQQSSINNYNSYSPNSDYLSTEQEYNNENRYNIECFDDKLMAPISELYQKEQENSFVFDEGRKDYAYFHNDNFGQNNNDLFNENITHYASSNVECNQQLQSNIQLKSVSRNQQDVSHYNQMQQYHCCEQRSEMDNAKQFYQQFNQEFSQRNLNESIYTTFPAQQYIDHTEFKNQSNLNAQMTSQNPYSNQIPQNQQIQQSQLIKSSQNSNVQKDTQVIQEFTKIVQSDVESGFNYYQYYKTYQEQGENSFIADKYDNNQYNKIGYDYDQQFLIENVCTPIGYNSSELMNNGMYEDNQNTPLYNKDTVKSKITKQDQTLDKEEMEKNDLVKIESQEGKSEDQIDEEETVLQEIKEGSTPSKKLSIDIHTSTSAALMNDEEPQQPVVQKDQEETLQKIDGMKMCNKKNVVKNIMNAFKNFILEAELKNTPKVNQSIVNLYNNNKSEESDSLPEIIKKFKRYINSKNFNHYSMRLLILHPNYGPVLQYFLKGPIYEWAKSCKANDLAAHFVMVDFLLLSFQDIKHIDELKRHEKKKAHYQ